MVALVMDDFRRISETIDLLEDHSGSGQTNVRSPGFRSGSLESKHARKAGRELARRQRLLEHLVGAGVARTVERAAADEPRHQHDGNAVADAAYLADQRRTRHSRHALIGD